MGQDQSKWRPKEKADLMIGFSYMCFEEERRGLPLKERKEGVERKEGRKEGVCP